MMIESEIIITQTLTSRLPIAMLRLSSAAGASGHLQKTQGSASQHQTFWKRKLTRKSL